MAALSLFRNLQHRPGLNPIRSCMILCWMNRMLQNLIHWTRVQQVQLAGILLGFREYRNEGCSILLTSVIIVTYVAHSSKRTNCITRQRCVFAGVKRGLHVLHSFDHNFGRMSRRAFLAYVYLQISPPIQDRGRKVFKMAILKIRGRNTICRGEISDHRVPIPVCVN
jgi:hypothetical protein